MSWVIKEDSQLFRAHKWSTATSDWFWGRHLKYDSYGRQLLTDPYEETNFCRMVRRVGLVPLYMVAWYSVTWAGAFTAFVYMPWMMYAHGSLDVVGWILLILAGIAICGAAIVGVAMLREKWLEGRTPKRKAAKVKDPSKPSVMDAFYAYAEAVHRGVCPIIKIERTAP